jgi:hypothetical protein
MTSKPETTALENVIDCAEDRSAGVPDVTNAFNVRVPGSMAARM